MNVLRPKLHIVLTAKAKHAEFKCPLCKKVFISEYHLKRHKSRRHSHHCENVIKGQEQVVQYRNALEERIRNRQAVNASHRMEKILRNLNLEETHLFDKSKKLNRTDISYGGDHFPRVSVLSPITSNTNILQNTAIKKIKTVSSSNITCKENNSQFRSDAYTWVTSKDLGSGDTTEVCFFNEKACQTELASKENKMLNEFENYNSKFVTNSLVKETQTDEADVPFISRLENLFTDNVDNVNQQSSVFEFVSNNFIQNEAIVKTAHTSTQTDEIIYKKNSTQICRNRSFDIYDEYKRSTLQIKSQSEPIIGLRESAMNCNDNKEIEKNNVENNVPVFDHSVVIAYSCNVGVANENEIDSIINKDYLTFEKEFQESFEARKNLLEKDDFMFSNDNLNDTSAVNIERKPESKIENEQISASNTSFNETFVPGVQDSFEAKKNLSSNDNLVVRSSTGESVPDVKCLNESIEKSDNPITQISVSSNESNVSDVIYPDMKNRQEDLSRASGKRHEDIIQNIQDELSARLRNLGVDPEWSGISDIIAKKTNAILTVRRINLSKKIPRFISLRTMLNNTIDQILEGKECGQ